MNDVAHPSLVTVKRPMTMLPCDFKQAIADLAKHALIGVQHVAGDFAVVERYPEEISYGHEIARPPVAEDVLGTDTAEDAQAGPGLIPLDKVGSPRPRTSEGFSRDERRRSPSQSRVVMRAPREGRESSRESAMPTEVLHASSAVKSRARVSSAQTKKKTSRLRPRSPKQIGGGNDRAASRKERIVVPEIRVSDVSRAARGYVVRVELPSADAVRAFVKAQRGAR